MTRIATAFFFTPNVRQFAQISAEQARSINGTKENEIHLHPTKEEPKEEGAGTRHHHHLQMNAAKVKTRVGWEATPSRDQSTERAGPLLHGLSITRVRTAVGAYVG